jgi:uncharacterized protein YsxB (DUF464 family)
MISVTVGLYCDEFSFAMEGHAGYNPGNDIVCSAASALGQALYGYLDNNRDKIAVDRMDKGKGEMHISVKGDTSLLPAFEVVTLGLMQIAKKYPEHVAVKIMRNPDAISI